MKRPLVQRLRDFFGIAWVSRIGESHPEFYLPLSVYKDTFKCHYCSNISPGKWCLHCDIHPARGTYYDEHGHPCKPTARIRPISKTGHQPAFAIIDELHENKPLMGKQANVEEADQAHIHTFPEGMYSHGRCYEKAQQDEGGNGMFIKAVHTREELFRVTDALDMLKKDYTIVKETGSPDGFESDSYGMPLPLKHDTWYVTEVEPEGEAVSTVGDIKVKLNIDTSEVQEALKDVERLSEGLTGRGVNDAVEDKLAYLDRLIALAHAVGQGVPRMDVYGRTKIVLNSIQDDLNLKVCSE
ncbi:hypothetical protein BSK49_18990 [Paenibacillus odorifer]|uniref:hypothetical protein n=1 Tax=Paenibacillus TaxID=44249 RepID=UPI00096DAF64|nr:hypothetical protein [Paenibacillus odorifer]OMD85603.1 hypothetical protein BSK49_18990 [Paenibacillus odorifer]